MAADCTRANSRAGNALPSIEIAIGEVYAPKHLVMQCPEIGNEPFNLPPDELERAWGQ